MASDPKHDPPHDPLAGLGREDDAPAPDLSAMFGELSQQIERERGMRAWLRSRSTPVRVAIAGAALLGLGAVTAFGFLRPDHAVYPFERMVAVLLFIATLIACDLLLALRPLSSAPLPRWAHRVAVAGALLGLAAVYALPEAHEEHPASYVAAGLGPLLVSTFRCLAVGLVLSAAVYALLRVLDRGGASRSLLAAACSGFAANFVLQLHCPATLPAHILVGHLGVALLFVAAIAIYRRLRDG